MFEVVIRTIKHQAQRYDTVGDYITDSGGVIYINVSDTGDWRHGALIAIHELVEKAITKHQGIQEEVIDEFDKEFERNRAEGDFTEPGDHIYAPYHDAHQVATIVEQIVAHRLGVDWSVYGSIIEGLEYKNGK